MSNKIKFSLLIFLLINNFFIFSYNIYDFQNIHLNQNEQKIMLIATFKGSTMADWKQLICSCDLLGDEKQYTISTSSATRLTGQPNITVLQISQEEAAYIFNQISNFHNSIMFKAILDTGHCIRTE